MFSFQAVGLSATLVPREIPTAAVSEGHAQIWGDLLAVPSTQAAPLFLPLGQRVTDVVPDSVSRKEQSIGAACCWKAA